MSAATDDHLRILDEMVTDAVSAGVAQRTAQDDQLAGRTVHIDGRELVNFASCSYLGLEFNPKVIAGVVDAVTRFGSQFSSSRVYLSAPAYYELEEKLSEIFGGNALAAPSTTMGHLSALPVLVGPDDVALLDHHVHNSVQMAASLLTAAGSTIEMIRHHNVELLEERILALRGKCRRIWFLVDGVCSMFGDVAPMADYLALLERHENLHLYVDDAHGMSWTGKHGRGYALGNSDLHPRMVLATSLNKAFGAAGGALVLPNEEMRRRIRTCGATLLFSGPIQPPMLGAGLASAKIHLDPAFAELQARYARHTESCHAILSNTDLPVRSDARSPVQFVEVGLPDQAQRLTKALMDDGFFTNVAQFPAVPIRRSGVRFTLTLHQTEQDVRDLVESLSRNFELVNRPVSVALSNAGTHTATRSRPMAARSHVQDLRPRTATAQYRVERAGSINDLDAAEWNAMLGERGSFDSHALKVLERTFREHCDPRNCWGFHYYRVVDEDGATQLATFFTDAIWKADMLASAEVSRVIEMQRTTDPMHLTHRVFSMGSLLTEGNHLYLNPNLGSPGSPKSQPVIAAMLSAVQEDAARQKCNTIALRDLDDESGELDRFLRTLGFISMPMPDSMELAVTWKHDEEYLSRLSSRARKHQRKEVRPFDDAFRVELFSRCERHPSKEEIDHLYSLYQNVKTNNLELNTFELPRNLFSEILRDEHWEIIALYANDSDPGPDNRHPVGMGVCYVGGDHYVPLIIGLDYAYVKDHGLYRQMMRHVIARARKRGLSMLYFGMGAELEKRRFGAKPKARFLFLQTEDHYVFDAVAHMSVDPVRENG